MGRSSREQFVQVISLHSGLLESRPLDALRLWIRHAYKFQPATPFASGVVYAMQSTIRHLKR